MTAEQACTDLATKTCAKMQECFPFIISIAYGDQATCLTRTKLSCATGTMPNGSGITPEKMSACASAFGALTCTEALSGTQPAACDIRGTLVNGTPCSDGAQCTTGYCKKTSATCGVCAAKTPAGSACQLSTECATGLGCMGAAGATTCQPSPVLGAACSSTQTCRADLYCHGGLCAQPVTTPGAPCTPTESGSCSTMVGLMCGATTSVCTTLGLATAGSPCGTIGGSYTLCKAGAQCKYAASGNASVCTAPAADGAACDSAASIGCLGPASCVTQVCRLPAALSCP